MLYALLTIAISTSEPVCDQNDGMCLLQLNKDKVTTKGPLSGFDFDDFLNSQEDVLDALEKTIVNHGADSHPECPGKPIHDSADPTKCSHAGIDIHVDSESIENYFGDNVLMKDFKYYLEDCTSGTCVDNELIDPDITAHRFPVGVSHVKVQGFDLAGNDNHCYRTVDIYDKEPPVFDTPDADVDGHITLRLDDETCTVDAGAPFAKYEAGGFLVSATDNCDTDVEIVKKIFDAEGTCVYDSSQHTVSLTLPLGPGDYHMTYEAIDGHSQSLGLPTGDRVTFTTTTHTVTLELVDLQGPYNYTGCPTERIEVVIEAHEDMGQADWTPPTVTGDNCGNEHEAYVEEQSVPMKYPGMMLPPGSHVVRYSLKDKFHNTMAEECIFEVHVVQKAHPVTVTCPPDVSVPTVENALAGIVHWDAPVAMQGSEMLDASHIYYPQGVSPGMMFPFGITTITVNATGALTGERIDEHLMFDECTFTVEVTDPFDPLVDGRPYRCKDKDSADVRPFKVCDGPDVSPRFYENYRDDFGYEVLGVIQKTSLSCCESEDDTLHECTAVPGSSVNKYCKPVV